MSAFTATSPVILDVEGTLARFGGDRDLFIELAGFLLKDLPPLFGELKSAVQAQDATAIRRYAHALKGLVAGCGGVRAAHLAQTLENAGHSGQLSHTAETLDSLETEIGALTKALRDYCDCEPAD
jgi:HPt (histidine-containing phosphotransfer) domain-containing protein